MRDSRDDQSSSVRRSVLAGKPTTSTFEKSFLACMHSLGTQDFPTILYSRQSDIIKTWVTPCKSSVKCTPANGGGRCRYVRIASYILFSILNSFSAIPGVTQARCNRVTSCHLVRQDPAHPFPSQEHLSDLLDDQQYSQGHSQQANSASTTVDGLHSDHSAQAYQKQGGAAVHACKSLPFVYAQSPLTY